MCIEIDLVRQPIKYRYIDQRRKNIKEKNDRESIEGCWKFKTIKTKNPNTIPKNINFFSPNTLRKMACKITEARKNATPYKNVIIIKYLNLFL